MGNSNYRIKSAVETSHTYYAFDNSLTWNEAKKYCEKLGGYLATITSYGEQQEINNLISDKGKNVYWLGGTNSQNDGSWKWITSEDWNYTNWGEGEPNNSRNDESYLEIIRVPFDKIKYGEWNDMSNDGDSSHCSLENHGFVCEWDKVLSEQKIQELIINASDEYNGHHYMFFENAATWEEAQDFCESMGGHLATITSEGENDFLFELMKTSGYDSAYFGFTDSYEEGEWAWITGERVRYTNWHSGEPNSENSNEDYAMFYFKFDDGTWNDGDFGGGTVQGGNVFICEWD